MTVEIYKWYPPGCRTGVLPALYKSKSAGKPGALQALRESPSPAAGSREAYRVRGACSRFLASSAVALNLRGHCV